MSKNKIIRDIVHGYIEIDSFTEVIISSLHFQRLKDIKQMTAQHVFPSANHNRFEHSLGVMYLSQLAFHYLIPQLDQMGITKGQQDALLFNFKLASLLHDIGHAPFSHLGENYYQSPETITNKISSIILDNELNVNQDIFSSKSKHELMSCLVILTIYREYFVGKAQVDLELICRCILGNEYSNEKKWPENVLVNLLNSGTIDIDKLDYLIRDAYMTGASVPSIDLTRLLKNLLINKDTKAITFYHRALPVIQNIIEARDSMYLWVYNHHIAVYTDFLIEYYIKHLILNYENGTKIFEDRLDPNEYFSPEAIQRGLVSDSDLWHRLKKYVQNDKTSAYTKVITPQIFKRQLLKPVWKTLYEFNDFINRDVSHFPRQQDIIKKLGNLNNPRYRVYVVKELLSSCGLDLGEIFIVPRSNKFYSLTENVFTVVVRGQEKNIENLLPQKDYKKMHSKISFYLFCREDKLYKVKRNFLEIINQNIPEPDDDITKIPKWLQ